MSGLEGLIKEVTPDAPSGESDLGSDPAFIDLEIKISGTPEREFDRNIVQEAKGPNWGQVRDAAKALLTRGHDLRVAMFLTRALLHTDGLKGLGTGLFLLQGLIDGYWETLYPRLDPDDKFDPIQRINILVGLSEGQEILGPLKKINLCVSPVLGGYSFRDILIASGKIDATANDKTPAPSMVDIEAAFKDSKVEDLAERKAAIDTALKNLAGLNAGLYKKIDSPHSSSLTDFKELQEVLIEMNEIMDTHMPEPEIADPGAQAADGGESPTAGSAARPNQNLNGTINSRKDVVRLLDQICKYYKLNEPASPVPLMLKRASQLVESDFYEIIKDIAPDSADKIKKLISGAGE